MDKNSSANSRFCCLGDSKVATAARSAAVPLAIAGGLAGASAGAVYLGAPAAVVYPVKKAAQLSMGAAFKNPATVPTGPLSALALGAQNMI